MKVLKLPKKTIRFWEYRKGVGIIELSSPETTIIREDPYVFTICAETENEALKLAHDHLFNGRPLSYFYGEFNGEKYHGDIKCII